MREISDRHRAFFAQSAYSAPRLCMSRSIVCDEYKKMSDRLPGVTAYYAVKSNPHPDIIRSLVDAGACFDVASEREIQTCLEQGAQPGRLSFGNSVKSARAIAYAYACGVDLFSFDTREELLKIAEHAPGARVYCRIAVDGVKAKWPLDAKFGCAPGHALELMAEAQAAGVRAVGVSFHVGSQLELAEEWDRACLVARELADELSARGLSLEVVNIGGGFPTIYQNSAYDQQAYYQTLRAIIAERFKGLSARLMCEPGRAVCAPAGVIECKALLVSDRGRPDAPKWAYLDLGVFHGLFEGGDGAIVHQFILGRPASAQTSPFILAGPSCDSVDVLFARKPVHLPSCFKTDDTLYVKNAGAYTAAYSTPDFNGFPGLQQAVID